MKVNYVFMSPFPFCSILLFAVYQFSSVHCQCTRNSSDPSSAPNFVCLHRVTVTRLTNCSTEVTERIVFPHNPLEPWWRDISFYEGQKIVDSSISVQSHGHSMEYRVDHNPKKNKLRITMDVAENDSSTIFQLRYTMINGVVNYTGSCNFDDEKGSNGKIIPTNAIAWQVGKWDKVIDLLTISFRTEIAGGKLRFGSKEDGTETGSEISYRKTDVKEAVTVHALESGGDICTLDWHCEKKSAQVFNIVFWSIFVSVTLCLCFCITLNEVLKRNLAHGS